ncbi:MAG: hypothetical protein J6I97_05305 [Agathobacter sp.]|nr:hypothetical protein [Agathobacter sp.]
MYLVSQDKKNLIKFEKIEVTGMFKSYSLTAYGTGQSVWATVGTYETEEQAKAELAHIIAALDNGQTIYEVR